MDRNGSDGNEDSDDENQGDHPIPGNTPSSQLPPPVFSPCLCRAFGKKHKQDCMHTDVSNDSFCFLLYLIRIFEKVDSSIDVTCPQTKNNQTNGNIDVNSSSDFLGAPPRSPQFSPLSWPMSPVALSTSKYHSPDSILPFDVEVDDKADEVDDEADGNVEADGNAETDDDAEADGNVDGNIDNNVSEIILSIPDAIGSSSRSQKNKSTLSIIPVHGSKLPPVVPMSKKSGVILVHPKGILCIDNGDYQDPNFWPGDPPITSSQPFLQGAISEAVIVRANLLRDKFLEDLGMLADESWYPCLGLLKATKLKLSDCTEVEKEKGQHEKNAFNGWSWAYMKEHPNPLQGDAGHHEFDFDIISLLI
jgi:hypothetical protein